MRILIIVAIVILVVLWVRAVIDVVRRRDLGTGAKVAWTVGLLVFPLIGVLVYILLRPATARVGR